MTRTDPRSHARAIAAAQTLGPALAKLAEVSRTDPAVCCQFVLRDEATGRPIELASIHEEWHDILTAHERVVIFSATELGKTSQVAVGRVLYEIGRNPNIRILILSAASSGAKKIVKAIKGYIESSTEYRMAFPGVVPDKSDTSGMWRDDAFIVRRSTRSKDPTVQASGYGGNILGARYDLIIIDDYLDAENTHSDHLRQKYYGWLKSTVESRRTADGRLWFIGNAWHPDDAMHRYAAEPSMFSKKYPVLIDGFSAWEKVWPLERIEKETAIRGPIESRRSMFCDPVADADRRFKLDYIRAALLNGDGIELAYSLVVVPNGYRTVTGVDLAVTKSTSGDETALVTIAVREKDQARQLLNIEAGRWGGPEIVSRIKDVNQRYNSLVVVESNGQQRMLKQFVNDQTSIPVKAFYTGKNKYDPAFGIESLAIEFSAGKWIIPNRGATRLGPQMLQASMDPQVRKLIDEMLRYDPASHTGDRLMACLPPGQLITTKRGLVAIEDVAIGDRVLTHRARWRPVTQTMSRQYTGDVVELKPRGMRPLVVTTEHPVFRATPRTSTRDRTNHLIPDRASWEFVAATELRAGRKMAGDFLLAPAAAWPEQAPEVDNDLAFFVGLYLAEGWAGHHQLNFAFNRSETYLAEFISRQASLRWGAKTSIYTRDGHGGMTVSIQSAAATRMFRPFGKRDTKSLPWSWMALPPRIGAEIVRGWLVGDGALSWGPRGRPHLRGVSVSRSLIYQMQQFLWRSGIGTAVCPFEQDGMFQGKPCGQLPAQQLSISESDSTTLLLDARPEELLRWGDDWAPIKKRSNSSSIEQEHGMAVRIGSVATRPYAGLVYNFHVDEDESYVAEGIAVHNCWIAREGARIAAAPAGVTTRRRRT